MKKQKNGIRFLQLIVLILFAAAFFVPENHNRQLITGIAVVGIIGTLLIILLPVIPNMLKPLRTALRKKKRRITSGEYVTDTESLLWRQISYQITGILQSAFPKATWEFIKKPGIDSLLNGKYIRIRTCGTNDYNFAEVHMDQYGGLRLQMMTIETLKPHASKDNEEHAPQVDPESWYTLIGKPLLTNLVGDLQARGYQKLFINEQGEIYIQQGDTPEVKARFEYFPSREYWAVLEDIFIRDELQVTETDQALELSWMS